MISKKQLSEIVCDAVKALQEPNGSTIKDIYSYAKENNQDNELSESKVKLGFKIAIDEGKLMRVRDGRVKLNIPNITAEDVKKFKGTSKQIMLVKANCGCPKARRRRRSKPRRRCRSKPRRRRSKCRSRSRRRRSRRRKKSCRSCTPIWDPKKKRRRRSSKQCPKKRRRRQKSCRRSCTPIWMPKRKKRCGRR